MILIKENKVHRAIFLSECNHNSHIIDEHKNIEMLPEHSVLGLKPLFPQFIPFHYCLTLFIPRWKQVGTHDNK